MRVLDCFHRSGRVRLYLRFSLISLVATNRTQFLDVHLVLWDLTEPIETTALNSNRDKNFESALNSLVKRLQGLSQDASGDLCGLPPDVHAEFHLSGPLTHRGVCATGKR
jgi:hypothetical protein